MKAEARVVRFPTRREDKKAKEVECVGPGVYRRTTGSYFIWYTDPYGKRRKETVGTRKQDAFDLIVDRKREVREGTWLPPEIRRKQAAEATTNNGMTFAEFVPVFLKRHQSRGGSTYYHDRLEGRGKGTPPVVEFFGELPLARIGVDEFDGFRRWRSEQVAASTVRKDLMLLGTMFRQATRWQLLNVNPAADIEKPQEPEVRSRAFTSEEYLRVEPLLDPDERQLSRMALGTSQSLGDVTGLEWDSVDERTGSIYFRRSKSGEQYYIAISPVVAGVLAWAKKRYDAIARATGKPPRFVFVDSAGKPYHTARGHFKTACRKVGVPWGNFKALRTTAATWADEAGASMESVQRALGHADIRTTQRFYVRAGVRSQVEKTRVTLDAVSARLGGPESAAEKVLPNCSQSPSEADCQRPTTDANLPAANRMRE